MWTGELRQTEGKLKPGVTRRFFMCVGLSYLCEDQLALDPDNRNRFKLR